MAQVDASGRQCAQALEGRSGSVCPGGAEEIARCGDALAELFRTKCALRGDHFASVCCLYDHGLMAGSVARRKEQTNPIGDFTISINES
jgi:hypothetical protein